MPSQTSPSRERANNIIHTPSKPWRDCDSSQWWIGDVRHERNEGAARLAENAYPGYVTSLTRTAQNRWEARFPVRIPGDLVKCPSQEREVDRPVGMFLSRWLVNRLIGRAVMGKPVDKAWANLRDELIPLAKRVAQVRAALPGRAAEGLQATASTLRAGDESNAKEIAAAFSGDRGPHPGPTPPAPMLPKRVKRTNPADEFLRDIYGDRYHTNGSVLAQAYARSLTAVPEKLHRTVAAHMRERPHGGIWVGDGSLLTLGHPEWSVATRGGTPEGWPQGTTWNDVGGAYDVDHRALLAAQPYESDIALHEFGHAVDHAFGMPSQGPAFAEVYANVLPRIPHESSEAAAYFAQPGGVGEEELFAHGFGWFHDSTEQPGFFDSVAAGRHLTDYYQAFEARIGIST